MFLTINHYKEVILFFKGHYKNYQSWLKWGLSAVGLSALSYTDFSSTWDVLNQQEVKMSTTVLVCVWVLFVVVCCDETRHYLLRKINKKKFVKIELDANETEIVRLLSDMEDDHYYSVKEVSDLTNLPFSKCRGLLAKLKVTYKIIDSCSDYRDETKVSVYKMNERGLIAFSSIR